MIRCAESNDAAAILRLTRDFSTSFATDEEAFHVSFAALLTDSNVHFAVAEVDGRIVGYVLAFSHCTLHANGRVAWVEEITVEALYRRRGIGRALMRNVENWAADHGCKLVALATRRASDFYEANGYEKSATFYRKIL